MLNAAKLAAVLTLSMTACAALGQAFLSVQNNRPDKPIVGLPFSADQTIQTVQHLANGITLTHRMTGHIYRSSAGLERVEATPVLTGGDNSHIVTLAWIVDRTQGTVTLVHVQSNFATVTHLPPNSTARVSFLAQPGDQKPESLRSGKLETSDLGQRTQDGVVSVGKLLTRTMPFDKVGNDAPFVSTNELWSDPALKIVVNQIERDPIDGDRIVEISNIHTGEPDPALFQVPEGFKVVDQPLANPGAPPRRPSTP
jgi:hypothetical protein